MALESQAAHQVRATSRDQRLVEAGGPKPPEVLTRYWALGISSLGLGLGATLSVLWALSAPGLVGLWALGSTWFLGAAALSTWAGWHVEVVLNVLSRWRG